jgi:hypothetical protein
MPPNNRDPQRPPTGPACGAVRVANVPVEPGNDLPPPGVVCVRGFARAPRSPTGHPRNKQNGSEECPRSSYQAGRGHFAWHGAMTPPSALAQATESICRKFNEDEIGALGLEVFPKRPSIIALSASFSSIPSLTAARRNVSTKQPLAVSAQARLLLPRCRPRLQRLSHCRSILQTSHGAWPLGFAISTL